jgi:hypothetical protein
VEGFTSSTHGWGSKTAKQQRKKNRDKLPPAKLEVDIVVKYTTQRKTKNQKVSIHPCMQNNMQFRTAYT